MAFLGDSEGGVHAVMGQWIGASRKREKGKGKRKKRKKRKKKKKKKKREEVKEIAECDFYSGGECVQTALRRSKRVPHMR